METEGTGLSFSIRITKEGMGVRLVKEEDGSEDAGVVAVRRVNELGYYNLGVRELASHIGQTIPKTLAIVKHLRIQDNEDYFKDIKIQSTHHKLYSQKALEKIRAELPELNLHDVWENNRPRKTQIVAESAG